MEHYKKSFIKKEFVFPVITAIIAVAITAIDLCGYLEELPFFSNELKIAEVGEHRIKELEQISVQGTVKKSDIPEISANTSLGSVGAGDTVMPLIYEPSYENTSNNFCLSGGVLPGEAGNAFIYCAKANGNDIRALKKGDTITVSTFYGEYTYTVYNTFTAKSQEELKDKALGLGSAVTLYTDKKEAPGISGSYFAAYCQMTSGARVAE